MVTTDNCWNALLKEVSAEYVGTRLGWARRMGDLAQQEGPAGTMAAFDLLKRRGNLMMRARKKYDAAGLDRLDRMNRYAYSTSRAEGDPNKILRKPFRNIFSKDAVPVTSSPAAVVAKTEKIARPGSTVLPLIALGIGAGALGYGAYKYLTRGEQR